MRSHAYSSSPKANPSGTKAARPTYVIGLVFCILVVAAFLRIYRLDSLPPGLFYDEALNGLDVLDILRGKLSILFERSGNPREPLFIYLQALSAYLIGASPFALRLTSAVVGIATVLVTYVAAEKWFGHRVGLLSMALAAVSLWTVDLSRVGFRANTAPLLLALTLLTLGKALDSKRRRYFLVSGLILGLSYYTYISARLNMPLVLAILLAQLVLDRQPLRGQGANLALWVAAALVAVAPLAAYFWGHPAAFYARVEQVALAGNGSAASAKPPTLVDNLLANAGMFFLAGDPNWRHNLAGRPVFDPVLSSLFVLGIGRAILSLKRRRRRSVLEDQGGRGVAGAVPIWLLLWLLVMMIPGVMSQDSPNSLQVLAAAPAVFILTALGIVWIWDTGARRFGRTASIALGLGVAAFMAWEGLATFDAYFNSWARQPKVYWYFDANLAEAARFLNNLVGDKDGHPPVYLYADRSPTIKFLANPSGQYDTWLSEATSFVPLPNSGKKDAYYVVAPTAVRGVLSRHFPNLPVFAQPLAPDGSPAFTVYRLPASDIRSLLSPQRPLGIAFGDQVELVGVGDDSAPSTGYSAGKSYYVGLLWRMLASNGNPYSFFVHSVDEQGRIWSQQDVIGQKQGSWQLGDLIHSRHEIAVPADAPAIPARVVAGVTVKDTGERLKPATNEPGNLVRLRDVEFLRGGAVPAVPSPAGAPPGIEIASGLESVSSEVGATTVRAGQTLNMEITWRLAKRLTVEPAIEISLY